MNDICFSFKVKTNQQKRKRKNKLFGCFQTISNMFSNYFQYASNVHNYNTRYASKQNLYVKGVRNNTGKETIGYAACIIWHKVPLNLKELSIYQFSNNSNLNYCQDSILKPAQPKHILFRSYYIVHLKLLL